MRVRKIHITPYTLTTSTNNHRTCLIRLPSSSCASFPRSSPVLSFTYCFSDERRHLRTETHTKIYSHCHISFARITLALLCTLYTFFCIFIFSLFSVTNAFTVPFNDTDVQFFVRLRTLCLCVLLADNQEIIRTLFTEELLMKGRFSPASVHAHDTCMHARQ